MNDKQNFFPVVKATKNYLTEKDLKLMKHRYGIIGNDPLKLVPFVKEWTGATEAGKDGRGIYYKF